MRKLIALAAALCMLLTMVTVPAMAESAETDWSTKEKLKITCTPSTAP